MNNFRNTVAVLALLCASGVAYAQESTPTAPAPEVQNKVDCPAAGSVPEADILCRVQGCGQRYERPATGNVYGSCNYRNDDEVPKQDNTAAAPAAPAPDSATTTVGNAEVPANAVLASQFMGQAVYTAANENIGEINDLIMNKELDNIVAVVGVGGFLGIGEKDVAIPIGDIKVVKDADNALRLTISASKEQLEALPVFDRTAMK